MLKEPTTPPAQDAPQAEMEAQLPRFPEQERSIINLDSPDMVCFVNEMDMGKQVEAPEQADVTETLGEAEAHVMGVSRSDSPQVDDPMRSISLAESVDGLLCKDDAGPTKIDGFANKRGAGDFVKLPSLATFSPEEQQIVKDMDSNGNGEVDVRGLVAGVKKHVDSHRRIRTLKKQQCCLAFGACVAVSLTALLMFLMSFAGAWKAKSLFTFRSGGRSSIVDGDGELVTVAEGKVSIPLGLAPFLSVEQLLDIEVVGYYDCAAQEEVLSRVTSVRRYVPAEWDEADKVQLPSTNYTPSVHSNYSVSFQLASGHHLVVDSDGEYIDFPEENRTQELCGDIRCSQLHTQASDVKKLEQLAASALGETLDSGRRLRRWRRRGNRGRTCRRCHRPPFFPPRWGRGRRGPGRRPPAPPSPPATSVPTPATPAPTPAPSPTTPQQQAAVEVAQAVGQMLASGNRGDILGGLVRLAFHDAATFDQGRNGADGCVDLAHADNNGLEPVLNSLDTVVRNVRGRLSRADVWALAATIAIQSAGGPQMSFHYGRVDVDGNGNSCRGTLPDAELGAGHIASVFRTRLGFSEDETVALFGAHVLGGAQRAISGYEGRWVRANDRFTNQYFQDLLRIRWNKRVTGGRTQWNGRPGDGTMMLNTDIAIAFDTQCGSAGGNSGCQCSGQCQMGFSSVVSTFSQDQGAFFQAFKPAFERLVALGSTNLQYLGMNTPNIPLPRN